MAKVFIATFSALKHRDYRRWWLGQCISLVSSAMQSAAPVPFRCFRRDIVGTDILRAVTAVALLAGILVSQRGVIRQKVLCA